MPAATTPEDPDQHDEHSEYDDTGDFVEYPSGIQLLTVVVALILALLLAVIDMTILATAIPKITDHFRSIEDVGWYAAVYFLTVASSQSTWGKAYKYFDLKTIFLIAIAIFEAGSLLCGMSLSKPLAIINSQ
jgi:MFS transporter, DHA2 family, glioxin efflux transporter